MDCKQFALIILAFLIWVGIQSELPDLRQNVSTIIPANYDQYSEALIQHIITANEAGAETATSAEILRGNMAQYTALAAGAAATQFFDVNGNILFDINPADAFKHFPEEATLWSELKGLWQTMNTQFMNANPVGKMLALMQMIGILKCAKWCITTACDMVEGAIDLGKWSYNMLAGLVRGPLSTTTTGVQDNTVHPNSPNTRFKAAVHKVIMQNTIIKWWLDQTRQNPDTLNDILTVISNNQQFLLNPTRPMKQILDDNWKMYTPEQPFGPVSSTLTNAQKLYLLSDDEHINTWKVMELNNQKYNQYNPITKRPWINPDLYTLTNGGGRRTKRRPYKSKRRRTKSRSSKKRRHYKTKKRVYRSTRFRTHR
jgi:hypothetical protein